MIDKNVKGNSINSYEGYEYITYDDGVISSSEPADEVSFAHLERQGYTFVRDENGTIVAAIAPRQEA